MKAVYFIILLLLIVISNGQNHNNNWYFGNHAGITFNTTPPSALANGQLNTFEGCATISNISGLLLFYTDGTYVYNKNHVQMANGYGLKGSWSATQSAVIVPKPGSNTLFYVFTVAKEVEADGFRYSIVDMTLNSGLGDVINKNTPIRTPVVEKVVAVKHANGSDIWVICHGWNNNEFYAYLLTASGLSSTPVTSAVGTIHDINGGLNSDNWLGYMKVSPDRSKIAVAVRQKSLYEVFSFDNATGILSNPVSLINTQTTTNFAYGAYGLEFSPNSRYLYVKNFGPGDVFQYDLSTYNLAAINASKTLVGFVTGNANYLTGAMQLGPDNKIYIVKYDQSYLAVISNPDAAGLACNLIDNAISLGSGYGKLGLPTTIENNFFNNYNAILENGCYADPYHFYLSDSTSITGVSWNFGDPASGSQNTSILNSPIHQFSGPGSYTVNAIVQYPGGIFDTLETIVSISSVPDLLVADSVQLCDGNSYLAQVQGSWISFMWNTGAITSGLNLSQAGLYVVSVTGAGGCVINDSLYCEVLPTYHIDIDTTFCSGTSIAFNGQTISNEGAYPFAFLSEDGCDSIVVLHTYFLNSPITDLDTSFCPGSSIVYNGQTISDEGMYSFQFVSEEGCDSTVVLHTYFLNSLIKNLDTSFCPGSSIVYNGQTISDEGAYSFQFVSVEGCDSTVVLNTHFLIVPEVVLPIDSTICLGEQIAIIPIISGQWDSVFWTNGSTNVNQIISEEGLYQIIVQGDCGLAQDDIYISIDSCISTIYFPNAFTPNGDYLNPVFTGVGENIFDFHLMVFNRWGQMLFESNSMYDGWDGTFKGWECPEGVYFWIADYSLYRNTEFVQESNKGSVTLFR